MWIRLLFGVAMMCLLPMSAKAQDGLRSPVLPEQTLNTDGAGGRDVFRVPPDFYNRPPDPGPSRLFFPYFLPNLAPTPDWYLYQYRPAPGPLDQRPRTRPASELPQEVTVFPSPTPPPLPPGKPKTFYVIPSCYAGDKPPEPGWLPAGCDLSKLRVVPPT